MTAGNADRGLHTPHPSKVCDLIVDHEGCISSPQCSLPCKSTGKPDRYYEIQVAVYSWPVFGLDENSGPSWPCGSSIALQACSVLDEQVWVDL